MNLISYLFNLCFVRTGSSFGAAQRFTRADDKKRLEVHIDDSGTFKLWKAKPKDGLLLPDDSSTNNPDKIRRIVEDEFENGHNLDIKR